MAAAEAVAGKRGWSWDVVVGVVAVTGGRTGSAISWAVCILGIMLERPKDAIGTWLRIGGTATGAKIGAAAGAGRVTRPESGAGAVAAAAVAPGAETDSQPPCSNGRELVGSRLPPP